MTLPDPVRDAPRTNAALYYHADGYVTSRERLMGRHAAGEGFLQGFLRHARVDTFYACTESREQFNGFATQARPLTGDKALEWLPLDRPERLAEAGTLYLPGPDVAAHAWRRCRSGAGAYSISGVTHTICTHRVMDSIGELLIAPVEEWDALICTSDAVRRGVENMLADYGAYLARHLDAAPVRTRAQLPVIPLGVDCDRFTDGDDGKARATLRRRHRIGADDICVLFFGRLSYHAKAHPMPMYQALEAAARAGGRRVHLLLAGWFATDGIRQAFLQGARALCPSVNLVQVDGRKPEIRTGIWRAADIFCSLSDNVQETFGLTPVEAMAAGLPVVASDWDGYRGTVENGVTGFLVPTTMAAPGSGEEWAWRHFTGTDNYDHYLGNVCQSIAVDARRTAEAFEALIGNPDLRRRMGRAGRERARRLFDWAVIIEAYQQLWSELAARRAAADDRARPRMHPLRGDPMAVFSHYPTRPMTDDMRIETAGDRPAAAFRRLSRLRMNHMGRELLAGDDRIEALLERLAGAGATRIADLVADDREAVWRRTLAWLAKMGVVRIADEPAGE